VCIFSLQNTHLLYHGCHINILLFDYRGYGKSTGIPSEAGLYIDAQAVYDYVRKRTDINQEKIFFFGRSLGGGVALHLGKPNHFYQNLYFLLLFSKLLISLKLMTCLHYMLLSLKILSHQLLIWQNDYFKFFYLIIYRFGAIKMW
jgi:fermentation-respiration switch protein FrsA (DUF1100 family)